MRRSLLFIPGNNPGMLRNADIFSSDAVIFDLEDAVSINEKDNARMLVSNFLKSVEDYPVEVVIRINGFDTPYYHDDLIEVVSDKIDTIMIPKAHAKEIEKLTQILEKLEEERKLEKEIKIIPIIELATSLLEVEKIAKYPRVNGILLGGEDYTSDLEVERTVLGNEIFYARSKIVVACKAYQIDAIDTPFTDVNRNDLLLEDAKFSKGLGMNAKTAIHPNQVEIINKVYSPTQEQITWAKRVIMASEEASKKKLGVFSLDGKMVDKPIISRAEKILIKAKKFKLI